MCEVLRLNGLVGYWCQRCWRDASQLLDDLCAHIEHELRSRVAKLGWPDVDRVSLKRFNDLLRLQNWEEICGFHGTVSEDREVSAAPWHSVSWYKFGQVDG